MFSYYSLQIFWYDTYTIRYSTACRNADISFKPLRTGINYILRVYKDLVCTSQRTQCVSIRKTNDVCYGHQTEQGTVLMDEMQGF